MLRKVKFVETNRKVDPLGSLPLFAAAAERERRQRWNALTPCERHVARTCDLTPAFARIAAREAGLGGGE